MNYPIKNQNFLLVKNYKKYIYLSKEDVDKKIIEKNNNDLIVLVGGDDMINMINACFWFEKYLNIKRYVINDININNLDEVINTFTKNIDYFYWIYKNDESKNKTIESIKIKFEHIKNLNSLQKIIAECYNHICENTIKITNKRTKIKNNIVIKYLFN